MSGTVLVVGAGPVGLTMAAELARQGVAVRLIEKAAAPTDKSRGLMFHDPVVSLRDPTTSHTAPTPGSGCPC